uniref:Uncharacterized protein n=2 Tax=Amphimedon queenslandica TaxID=400682 RepID=A0A1X7UL74_AMPQE
MFLCSYGFELDDDTVTNASYELKGLEGIVKFSSRWLLQQLIIYLHEHLSYKCIHKKFGTILYNKRGDLLKSLSWALGSKGSAESSVSAFSLNSPNNESELLDDAGKIINALIHKEIDRISQSFTNSKFDPCSFKLKESIEAINPMLWRFLCTITKSVREYLGKAVPPSKEVMRYFLLCQLMHCANQQFLSPLHYILADTIELYGGSRKLMKLFNRLGIVCSTDTHDRIVTEIAENERAKQVSQSLIPNAFTVTSVDNIDILKSHAAVYCGDQGRSYHGTTIQIVQPNPLLLLTSGSMLGCTHNEKSAALNESVIPTESAALNESVIPTESAALNESCALIPTDSNYTCNYPDNMPNDSMLTMAIATHNLPDTTIAMTAPSNLHVADATSDLLLHYSKPPLPKKRRTVSVLTIGVEMNGFKENEKESNEKKKIEYRYLCYMYCKEALQSEKLLKPLHQFLSEETNLPTSNIYYMEVIDENPDSTETMKLVSELLLDEPALNIGGYTVVVGDGKTYTHLQKVKRLYGKEMTTLLIYPGLKELAEAAGFKGATLKALQNCSNFKHSHHFLLQTWESLYRVMLQQFLIDKPNVMGDISIIIKESELRNDTPINLIEHIKEYMGYKQYNSFLTFIEEHAIHDDTWQFWARFVFEDCMAYVNLFIAIRHRNWHLRIAAIKLMAPLFAAFDRTCYERLIPAHLADIQTYPKNVLECFENGGFAVSINGNGGRSVALDEAHEMCVNKDLKMAIARPTQAYLQKMSIYLRYRVTQHKNLINELFSKDNEQIPQPTLYEQESLIWKDEANIKSMTELIENFQLLPSSLESNRGLFNPFSKVHATAEQSHDLLNYRDIGNRQFEQYVTHRIAQTPSTSQAPVRKKRLLTMSSQKQKRKRETSKEKELHQVIKCIRRKMSWMNETGERFEPADEQYSVYPRAICDTDGSPHKGNKCIWTSKVESRGFRNTCFPFMAFEYLAPHMNLNTIEGVLLFSVFVIIGSNIFSNVPLVILIVGRVSDLCDDCGPLGGLLLAWISTIAGNFTLIGSVANLIVAEKARSSAEYRISFLGYFIFGFPSTLVILYACLPVVYFMGKLAAKI